MTSELHGTEVIVRLFLVPQVRLPTRNIHMSGFASKWGDRNL